jgi:peptidoglycan/LPS O-acetylase OafA/YrhL
MSNLKVTELPDRRSPALDTLRGCAVLAVFVFHYFNNTSVFRTPALSFLQEWTSCLFYGVDLFFVLSGFLIGGALMESRASPNYFRAYFAKRIGRIFPLYFLWLGLFLVMTVSGFERFGGAFPWLLQLDGMPISSYFFFTQNIWSARLGVWGPAWLGITWTLAIEVQFYILAALVIYATPVRFVGAIALAIILGAAAFKYFGSAYFSGHALLTLTISRLDAPFAGVLCAWIWRSDRVRSFIGRHRFPLKSGAVALVAVHYCYAIYGENFPIPILTVNAVVFGLLVLVFAGPDVRPAGRLVQWVRWSGVRCYAIYIFHVGILGLVSHIIFKWPPNIFPPGTGWPAVLVAAIVTFGLAAFSWRMFEKPIIIAVAKRISKPRVAPLSPAI